jgi:N-hydroxyarylamine O-acetyltransferase
VIDLDAYLERLGLSGRPSVDEIHRAHSTSIPFENLDPQRGVAVSLDPGDLQRKLVQERRGGYCFEQNLLLKAALEAIGGWEVDMHLARVRYRSGGAIHPRSHIVLGIRSQDGHWLADVGYGLGTLFEPLPFAPGQERVQSGWRYRLITEDGGETVMQRMEDGDWVDIYGFVPEPVPLIDVETSNWWVCTHPRSPFVSGLIVALQGNDGTWVSVNDRSGLLELVERTPTRSTTTALDREQLPELLAERFGLTGFRVDRDGRVVR